MRAAADKDRNSGQRQRSLHPTFTTRAQEFLDNIIFTKHNKQQEQKSIRRKRAVQHLTRILRFVPKILRHLRAFTSHTSRSVATIIPRLSRSLASQTLQLFPQTTTSARDATRRRARHTRRRRTRRPQTPTTQEARYVQPDNGLRLAFGAARESRWREELMAPFRRAEERTVRPRSGAR